MENDKTINLQQDSFENKDIKWLNNHLRNEARKLGLCDKWFNEWHEENYSFQQLIDKFIDGLDFCFVFNFPNTEFIKKYFPKELLRKNSILVDDRWSLLNPKYAVLLGNSESNIRYNGWTVGSVHLKGISTARILVKDNCHLIINVYDDAGVHIICESNKKIPLVLLHGNASVDRVSFDIVNGVGIQIKRED